jgi:hypothetical protein
VNRGMEYGPAPSTAALKMASSPLGTCSVPPSPGRVGCISGFEVKPAALATLADGDHAGRGRSVARDGTGVTQETSKFPHDVEPTQDRLMLVQGMARCFAFQPGWRCAWWPS